MSVEIRNLPTNPNPLAFTDFVPLDPSAVTTTVKNTINDIISIGTGNTNSGTDSRVEGQNSTSSGNASHAEGDTTTASGDASHAEGSNTTASGNNSHAEGVLTVASGLTSHAEGASSQATGVNSHAEGVSTKAAAIGSHAEGHLTTVNIGANYGHAEGVTNTLGDGTTGGSGLSSHVEGSFNTNYGQESFCGGTQNTINNGVFQTLVHGNINMINSGVSASIVVGSGNVCNSSDSVIFGVENATTVNANDSFVSGGGGIADNNYEFVIGFNDNQFSNFNRCQTGIVGLSNGTSNATPIILYTDPAIGTSIFHIPTNTALKMKLTCIGFSTAGTASFSGSGTIKNLSGTVSLVSAITMTQDEHDGTLGTTSVAVTADNTNKALQVQVTGVAATTIAWVCKVEYLMIG